MHSGCSLNCHLLRAFICSLIAANALPADFSPQTNGSEYFKKTLMDARGTYASDEEIKAACELLALQIIVYTDLTHDWLCYYPYSSRCQQLPALFLHHMPSISHAASNQFQLILNVSVASNSSNCTHKLLHKKQFHGHKLRFSPKSFSRIISSQQLHVPML